MTDQLLEQGLESDSFSSGKANNEWWQTPDLNSNGADANDVVLAREMFELSMPEREKIYEDIHCVAKAPEEAPDFIAERLTQMDAALSKIPKSKRKALERAIFLKPSLPTNQEFKLMFLRADCYDATKAATRMAKFYEKKLSLFGREKLAKKITSEDLIEEDFARLDIAAGCRIDVEKDPRGRPIWFYDASKHNFDSEAMDSMVRHRALHSKI
jgi:hypothetical protein